MNILIIGAGGREHALAWKLSQSPRVKRIFCAPGNGGTEELGTNLPIKITDVEGLVKAAKANSIDFTVVGPDDALAAGVVDEFKKAGLKIFGPTKSAARLESSKIFAKEFFKQKEIPTGDSKAFSDYKAAIEYCKKGEFPIVIKADGLATGKGVIIANTFEDASKAMREMMIESKFGVAGKNVLIEEFLIGRECSLHLLIDGTGNYKLLPTAQDYKRLTPEADAPNTGGMGTASPPTVALSEEIEEQIKQQIVEPLVQGMQRSKIDFQGLLFPGLIITKQGPKLLELNARFGDPETQVILPRIKGDLLSILEATVDGKLKEIDLQIDSQAAVCVVLASAGYPATPKVGVKITGLENFKTKIGDADSCLIFHAGTKRNGEGEYITSGGRVLGVTALGKSLKEARDKAYECASQIHFEGKYARPDIADAKPL